MINLFWRRPSAQASQVNRLHWVKTERFPANTTDRNDQALEDQVSRARPTAQPSDRSSKSLQWVSLQLNLLDSTANHRSKRRWEELHRKGLCKLWLEAVSDYWDWRLDQSFVLVRDSKVRRSAKVSYSRICFTVQGQLNCEGKLRFEWNFQPRDVPLRRAVNEY